MSDAERWGRIGGLTSWSRNDAETLVGPAHAGFRRRFERLVDPERVCLSCNRLIDRGSRCTACQRAKYRERNRTRPQFEVQLYGSAAWRRLADAVVADAEACHWCGTSRAISKLTADHILPVRLHPDLGVEPENVVAACRSCQERRKRQPDPRTWPQWARRPRWQS